LERKKGKTQNKEKERQEKEVNAKLKLDKYVYYKKKDHYKAKYRKIKYNFKKKYYKLHSTCIFITSRLILINKVILESPK